MLMRAGGTAALYAGIRPTLIRAFPANAAQWLTWECCMRRALSQSHLEAKKCSWINLFGDPLARQVDLTYSVQQQQ